MIRGVKFLQSTYFTIDTFVTDRHKQISKWFREQLPNTKHCYDIWHVAKSK